MVKAVAVWSTPGSSGGNANLTFQTRESVDRLFILTENTVLSFRTDLSIIGMDSGTFKTRTAELTGVRSHSSEAQAHGWQLYSLAGLGYLH